MDKKEEFKKFVSNHPELVNFIKSKEMTWQNFYEIYDIYGESDDAWGQYFRGDSNIISKEKITELAGIFKKINFDNIEHHINNAQKAIGIIQELTKKTPDTITAVERPITKIYGD